MEFFIIIAIIGIIAGIAIPQFLAYMNPNQEGRPQPLIDAFTFSYFPIDSIFGYIGNIMVILFLLFWGGIGALTGFFMVWGILEWIWEEVSEAIRNKTATIRRPLPGRQIKQHMSITNGQALQPKSGDVRKRAEDAVEQIYEAAELGAPKRFIWLASPFEGLVAATLLAMAQAHGKPLYKTVIKRRKRRAGFNFWRNTLPEFESEVDMAYWAVFSSVKSIAVLQSLIEEEVRADIEHNDGERIDEVIAEVTHKVESQARFRFPSGFFTFDMKDFIYTGYDLASRAGHGAYDAEWLAKYRLCHDEFHPEWVEPLSGYFELIKYCGWWWPFEEAVIMTEKHVAMRRGEGNMLHSDDRPALEFADGWGVYMTRGVKIPKLWGETPEEEWRPEWIMETENIEQRRQVFEKCGYARVLKHFNSVLIHKEADMELHQIFDIDVEPVALLKVTCPSTGAYYALRVPPEMTDCETARRWTFGDKSIDFIRET